MTVVSDTSPLLNLAIIGRLDLLKALYQEILIPPAVFHELVVMGAGMPGAKQVKSFSWINVIAIQNKPAVASLKLQLHLGEAEAIALAIENSADLLLVDERKARYIASNLGVNVIGLLGVLIEAKFKNLIPLIKPLLDQLQHEANFYISNQLVEHVLEVAGELN